jgi:SAM-dependent methyltransferase
MTSTQQENKDRRLYDDLAWLWPIVSPPADYRDEATEFHDLIQGNGIGTPRQLLHLGCGAGHLDSHLKRHYQITGVDLSEAMLDLARPLNSEVTYIQGDFRTIRLEPEFDAVILADASDYLLTNEAMVEAFTTAYRHLRSGGVFCTYAEETIEQFVQNKTRTAVHARGNVQITAIENVYDPDPSDTSYELTLVYLIRRGLDLQVEVDRHQAGLFSINTWIEKLEAVGFAVEVIQYPDSGPMFIGKKVLL